MTTVFAITKDNEIQEQYAYTTFDRAEDAKINLENFCKLEDLEISEFDSCKLSEDIEIIN